MVFCEALGCSMRSGRKSRKQRETEKVLGRPLRFYRFPCDPTRKHQWIQSMKRLDFTPSTESSLCCLHFEPSCFEQYGHRFRLLKNACPTIFSCFLPLVAEKWQCSEPTSEPVMKLLALCDTQKAISSSDSSKTSVSDSVRSAVTPVK